MKVIVGMSGGVDSSVACARLVAEGHDVTGVFMKNWEEEDNEHFCSAADDLKDARAVCDKLGIECLSVNFAKNYWDKVFETFLQAYQNGQTPNPDILCNKEIKFKAFLDYAIDLGAEKIATGHYTRVRTTDNGYQLLRGVDSNKDQSYFLYALNQTALAHALFPIGDTCKPEIREQASQYGFVNHAKRDSTGICFIGERRFKEFMSHYLPAKPGEIVDDNGRVIGEHHGIMYYTIGQRQGLAIGGHKDYDEKPWFIAHKDVAQNRLVAVQGHDHPRLMNDTLTCRGHDWISGQIDDALNASTQQRLSAKIRYRGQDAPCQIQPDGDTLKVRFVEPQWAIAAGQSIVFYDNEVCLGGSIIQ